MVMMLSAYLPTEKDNIRNNATKLHHFLLVLLTTTPSWRLLLSTKKQVVRGMRVTELFTTVFFFFAFRWFDKLIYGTDMDVGLL